LQFLPYVGMFEAESVIEIDVAQSGNNDTSGLCALHNLRTIIGKAVSRIHHPEGTVAFSCPYGRKHEQCKQQV
jgi:hypothetical protein